MNQTLIITTSIPGDDLAFAADSLDASFEDGVLVIKSVFCSTELTLVFPDIRTSVGEYALSAVGSCADMVDASASECREFHFARSGATCSSEPIKTPHIVNHTQEIEIALLAWSKRPAGDTLGSGPDSARGRLPVKIIRVPDGGG